MKQIKRKLSNEPSKAKVARIVKKAEKYPEQMTREEWNLLYRVVKITEAMQKAMDASTEETKEA